MKTTLPTLPSPFLLLLLLLLLTSHAAAAPLPATPSPRSPKSNDEDSANFFVTVCADKVTTTTATSDATAAWGGGGKSGCRAARFDPGKCAGLGDLDDRVSAVDPRGFDCTFYVEPGCPRGGRTLAVRRKNGDLFDNGGMDDAFSGFLCWR